MAIERNFTGFEFADSGEIRYGSGTFSGTLNSFPSDGTARSGSRYLRADASTSSSNLLAFPVGSIVGTTGTVTAGNHKRASVRGYFRLEAAFNNGQIRIAGFGGDAGTCTVWFGNENTAGGFTQAGSLIGLRIGSQTFQHNPGVSVPFGAQSITANVWYRMLLDLDILVDGTNSVLSATLRITEDSDSPSVDFTLTNTANIGANVDAIDQFALGYSSNSIGSFGKRATMHWDDVVYIAVSNTDAVAGQPTLPTQTHIYAIVPPTGAASNTGWSGTYADVDEYPGSGADTMSSSTAGAEVEFTHATAIALGYGSITAMKLYVNALITGAGTGSVDYMLNGTAKNVTLVTNYPFNSPSDPVGGVSFSTLTAKAFSATTFGIRKANGTQATFLANIGLEVIGDLAAYGNGSQIRGETQIKAGSIYDAQIADTASIARHKIRGLNDGPSPVFFPDEEGRDDWMIPGPPGSVASVRIPVVPVFFPDDGEDAMLMAASSSSSSGGGGTTNNYNTYLGGNVLLAELTASASSSLDFATRNMAGQSGALFQSDYDQYVIEIVGLVPATDNVDLLMRCSTDGGATYDSGANYGKQVRLDNAAFNTVAGADTGLTSITWVQNLDTTVTQGSLSATIKAHLPLSASLYKAFTAQGTFHNNDTHYYSFVGEGRYISATAVNALRFILSSGNIASGVVRIYGVSKTAGSLQNAPAHGMVLLHNQTVSGAASLDVVSRNVGSLSGAIFQSDYDSYVFEILDMVPATNGATLNLRCSTDGGATYDSGANYRYAYHFAGSQNTGAGANGSNTATAGVVYGTLTSTASIGSNGTVQFVNPLSAIFTKTYLFRGAFQAQDANYYHVHGTGAYASTTAVNAIRFLMSSGNLSGTVRVYGLVKDATYPVSTIQTGTHASRPTAGNAGRIYLPNDGYSLGRDSGTAWETFGPVFPFTLPSDTGFSWVNQGGATLDVTKDALTIVDVASGSGTLLRGRVKTAPATPYVITAYLLSTAHAKEFHAYGLGWRNSGSGSIVFFNVVGTSAGSYNLNVQKFTGPTAFSANYQTTTLGFKPNWLRITDDGVNRICWMSEDGQNWVQVHSIGRTDFITPDQIGFFVQSSNTLTPNFNTVCNVLSWKQA
jgi:hypothetical protein